MIILMICAYLLACGNEFAANMLAVYAYYFLVVGVVLQLICYIKYGEKD
jgi:heme/copper-type cytochrome/quinol oxidase subunit 4